MTSVKKKECEGCVEITTIGGNTRKFYKLDGAFRKYQFANGRQLEVFNIRYINTDDNKQRIICDDGTCLYIAPSEGWFVGWQNRSLLDENYRF